MQHFPVLLEESIDFLVHDKNGIFIDTTFGRGGHSRRILEQITSKGSLTAFDKDPDAISFANKIKNNNFNIYHDSFMNLEKYFTKKSVDGILYDLGVCSSHFDDETRGFSFQADGPLDMRFDNTKGTPLSSWLNEASKEEIAEVLFKYGNESHAKIISNSIENARLKKEINSTIELSKIIEKIYPEKRKKIHPATKSFQAFRIFINDEINEIDKSLSAAKKIIKKNGIIVTIAFHSLEDSLIKNFFKPKTISLPKDIPINNEFYTSFQCIAKKIKPSKEEIKINNRSRSAIMRVYQKI